MKQVLIFLALVAYAYGNCGCLNCCKNLRVVNPTSPVKIIYRGQPTVCPSLLPYSVQVPVNRPSQCQYRDQNYQLEAFTLVQPPKPTPLYSYSVQVQVPCCQHKCTYLTGLSAGPDRIVLPLPPKTCPPVEFNGASPGPILEVLRPSDLTRPATPPAPQPPAGSRYFSYLPARYDATRSKRSITLRTMTALLKPPKKRIPLAPDPNFRRKFKRRPKRAITFDEDSLPFYKITSVESESEENGVESAERVGQARGEDPFLQSFNFGHLIPHTPLFYILNAPLRLFKHLSNFRSHISPAVHAFPKVLGLSKHFFKNLRRNFHKNFFDIFSHLVGNFDGLRGGKLKAVLPRRKREDYQPEYSLAHSGLDPDNSSEETGREKRSIVVVRDFIRDEPFQLGLGRKKVFVEGAKPKVLMDNLGKSNGSVYSLNYLISRGNSSGQGKTFQDKLSKLEQNRRKVFVEAIEPNVLLNNFKKSNGPGYSLDYLISRGNSSDLEKTIQDRLEQNQEKPLEEGLNHKLLNANSEKPNRPNYSLAYPIDQDNSWSREKRAIVKLVDESEVEDFIQDKLSKLEQSPKKFVLERLKPKLLIDNSGKPFLEIDGYKRPIKRNKGPIVSQKGPLDDHNIRDKITTIIEQAKLMATRQSFEAFDEEMNVQTIREKITLVLNSIKMLINFNFEPLAKIYENLQVLQRKKEALVTFWKPTGTNLNSVDEKIKILGKLRELQSLKDLVLSEIVEKLQSGPDFSNKNLVKMLVGLQKLQCVIFKTAEDFAQTIRIGGSFSMEREVRYVNFLDQLTFHPCKSQEDILHLLKKDRDLQLQKEIALLEALKKILEAKQGTKIEDLARVIWEIKNIEKLQKDSIEELKHKIARNLKIRKELKIIFDLQKQLEGCERKQDSLIGEITAPPKAESAPILAKVESAPILTKPEIRPIFARWKKKLAAKKPVKIVSNGYTLYRVNDEIKQR